MSVNLGAWYLRMTAAVAGCATRWRRPPAVPRSRRGGPAGWFRPRWRSGGSRGSFSAKRAEFQFILVIRSTSARSALADEPPTWPVICTGVGTCPIGASRPPAQAGGRRLRHGQESLREAAARHLWTESSASGWVWWNYLPLKASQTGLDAYAVRHVEGLVDAWKALDSEIHGR